MPVYLELSKTDEVYLFESIAQNKSTEPIVRDPIHRAYGTRSSQLLLSEPLLGLCYDRRRGGFSSAIAPLPRLDPLAARLVLANLLRALVAIS